MYLHSQSGSYDCDVITPSIIPSEKMSRKVTPFSIDNILSSKKRTWSEYNRTNENFVTQSERNPEHANTCDERTMHAWSSEVLRDYVHKSRQSSRYPLATHKLYPGSSDVYTYSPTTTTHTGIGVPQSFYMLTQDGFSIPIMPYPYSASHCRRRKARTVFTDSQQIGLEEIFETQMYLSTTGRIELAQKLELTEVQVKTWFQNRRMKVKRIKRLKRKEQRLVEA